MSTSVCGELSPARIMGALYTSFTMTLASPSVTYLEVTVGVTPMVTAFLWRVIDDITMDDVAQ